MAGLLETIKLSHSDAADVLIEADYETDERIQSLTRQDLHELFPLPNQLRLRKELFNMIHKPRPTNELLKELKELMQRESAQTDNGVLMDHVEFIKLQVNIATDLLKTTNELLKCISTHLQDSKANNDSINNTSAEGCQWPTGKRSSIKETVKYRMVVRGTTFDAHNQLMKKLNDISNCNFVDDSEDSQITVVFCPITSRIESDIKAAMNGVPVDKQVILVKMHHVYEPKSSLCGITWTDDPNIALQVDVFYHDSKKGLLKCKENDLAVCEIQKLLKLSTPRKYASAGNSRSFSFNR